LKSTAPVLVSAGQHDQSFNATEPILWSELPAVARPFVKWAGEVRRLGDLPRLVHRAAKTALAHPTGPVFLSVPADVLNEEGDIDLGSASRVSRRSVGDRAAIDEVARLLAKAERPLLIVGDWVSHGDAVAEAVALAETLGASVVTESFAGTCNFPFQHPLHLGPMPRPAARIRARLAQHDVVLAICGPVFTLPLPSQEEPIPPGVTMLHLDVDPWEIGKNYAAAVGILGDPKATLPELTEEVRRRTTRSGHPDAARRKDAVRAAGEQARADLIRRADGDAGRLPMAPLTLVREVARAVTPEMTIIDESISSGAGIRHLFPCADAKSFFGIRGGGIGWGLPAALGAKLALPQRPVVALVGDGSAMYTIQALWTAAHESLAIVYVIFNNGSYRILKQRTRALKGFSAEDDRYVGMDLDRPRIDYVGLARSLGVPGVRVEKASEVAPAVGRALADGGPYLIDAVIDPAFT